MASINKILLVIAAVILGVICLANAETKKWMEYKRSGLDHSIEAKIYEEAFAEAKSSIMREVCSECPQVCNNLSKKWMEYRK